MSNLADASPAGVAKPAAKAWEAAFHLLVLYLVWGSTYLAIRIAVREGSGFPPFSMGSMRLLVAGSLLLVGSLITKQFMQLTRRDFITLLLSGLCLWVGGNGLVIWAEQRANSGYAALLVAAVPIWVAVIEAVIDRKLPKLLLTLSLFIGFLGIGVLTYPVLSSGSGADFLSVAALMMAPMIWAVGSVLQQRRPVKLHPIVSSGYQQVFAGLGFGFVSLLMREPLPHPTPEAWWAWGYLVVFGSLLAFTSFVMALRLLPTTLVSTYAYVNPVVAVFLGWLILQEPVTLWTIGGTAMVLVGVAGTFKSRNAKPKSR